MSYPTKSDRKACWDARDNYWQCLDSNNNEEKVCKKFRQLYEKSCSLQWVKHFDRKRNYNKFKEDMDKNDWFFGESKENS